MKEGDRYVLSMEKKDELKDLFSELVADSLEERIKLLLIEGNIIAWAKGRDVRDEDAKVYFYMLYRELKKIRERSLKIRKKLQK